MVIIDSAHLWGLLSSLSLPPLVAFFRCFIDAALDICNTMSLCTISLFSYTHPPSGRSLHPSPQYVHI